MVEEALYNPGFHSKMDYEIFILHRRTPEKIFDVIGYELSIFNPERYAELSELLGREIISKEPFVISAEDYHKFEDFVRVPSRHYIGIMGDKQVGDK